MNTNEIQSAEITTALAITKRNYANIHSTSIVSTHLSWPMNKSNCLNSF